MPNDTAMQTSQIRSSQRGIQLLIVALIAVGCAAIGHAQGTLTPVPQIVFLDASGNPINNGKICTYAAGTTTPLATYSDVTLTTPNANPIRTNSAGRPTTGGIYLSATSYKFVVLTAGADGTCATGTTVYTQDNVGAVPATAVGLDVTGTAGEALNAGEVVYLSDGSGALTAGRWYKADADTTYSSATAAMVGIVPSAIASGASGSIRIGGRITGLSGLTAGELYYASATAGALTATPPTNAWNVGKADTTTSLVMSQNQGGVRLPDSDGTHNGVMRITQNLTADRLWNVTWGDAALTTTFTVTGAGTFLRSDGTATWAGSTLILPNAATANRIPYATGANTWGESAGLTFDGTDFATTGDVSLGGGDLIGTANTTVRRNTSDGSDSGILRLTGAGAIGSTRGAWIDLSGNEHAATSDPGDVRVTIGDVASAEFRLSGGSAPTTLLTIAGSDGATVLTSSNAAFDSTRFNNTATNGGGIGIQRSGTTYGALTIATNVSGGFANTDAAIYGVNNLYLHATTEVRSTTIYNTTAADAANVFVQSDGTLGRSTSSLAFKNWRPLTLTEARQLLRVQPIAYTSRLPNDDPARLLYGFGAEQTFAVARPFGVPDQTNYDIRAIVAASTLLVQQHDDRLDTQLDLIAGIEARLRVLEAENAELRARLGLTATTR